jgi:hypothetical protein
MANSHWPTITPDCLVFYVDHSMNYSRGGSVEPERYLFDPKIIGLSGAHRTVRWVAPDRPVLPRPTHLLLLCAKFISASFGSTLDNPLHLDKHD